MPRYALQDFPPHLKDLVDPLLSVLNEGVAEATTMEMTSPSLELINTYRGLLDRLKRSLSDEQDALRQPNMAVLLGRLAQELDYPSPTSEIFRQETGWIWLAPFIAGWYLSQKKINDARALVDQVLDKIRVEVEKLQQVVPAEIGKIQAYLEALHVRGVIQLETPDKAPLMLTLRKAMAFLEKLEGKGDVIKETRMTYLLRFSALQLLAEMPTPDLDLIEAIERNVDDSLHATQDHFSKTFFLMVIAKSLAILKEYHQLEETLQVAWESAQELQNSRMMVDVALSLAWTLMLRLRFEESSRIIESALETLVQGSNTRSASERDTCLVALSLLSSLDLRKASSFLCESRDGNQEQSESLFQSFLSLYMKTRQPDKESSDDWNSLKGRIQPLLEKAIERNDQWLETCLKLLILDINLRRGDVGSFFDYLVSRDFSNHFEMMKQLHSFLGLQVLNWKALADLSTYWSSPDSFNGDRFISSLREMSSLLKDTRLPELMSLGYQLEALSYLVNGEFDQIFTIARKLKEFNRDLLQPRERERFIFFLVQVEWMEREIAMEETLYLSPLAEPPAPDSPEALRHLFFNDKYRITSMFLAEVATILRILQRLNFTILLPSSPSFFLVESFFRRKIA